MLIKFSHWIYYSFNFLEARFICNYHGTDYNCKNSVFNRWYTEAGLVINEVIRELPFFIIEFYSVTCIVQKEIFLNKASNIFKITFKWKETRLHSICKVQLEKYKLHIINIFQCPVIHVNVLLVIAERVEKQAEKCNVKNTLFSKSHSLRRSYILTAFVTF